MIQTNFMKFMFLDMDDQNSLICSVFNGLVLPDSVQC